MRPSAQQNLGTSATQSEVFAIGIDLGGTKIAAGLVSFPSGKIHAKEIVPTLPARGGEAVLADTLAVAQRMKNRADRMGAAVLGIGLGIAELVNLDGEITSEYSIRWRSLPARQCLSEVAPTRFESDARAPAVAEALFGAGAKFKNFVYLTVGTGISYSLLIDGQPYAGAHGHAIILASGPLSSECEKCGFIANQVLEEFAAGPSLVARYNQHASATATKGQEVTAAAASGDPVAKHVVESAGAALGNSVGFLVNVLDPEAIVVGGGLGLAGGLYWDSFVQSTRSHIWSDVSTDLPIIKAQLGAEAGLIGAAAMIWKHGVGKQA
jgi:glucokinase